jgi:hypothetical protein
MYVGGKGRRARILVHVCGYSESPLCLEISGWVEEVSHFVCFSDSLFFAAAMGGPGHSYSRVPYYFEHKPLRFMFKIMRYLPPSVSPSASPPPADEASSSPSSAMMAAVRAQQKVDKEKKNRNNPPMVPWYHSVSIIIIIIADRVDT